MPSVMQHDERDARRRPPRGSRRPRPAAARRSPRRWRRVARTASRTVSNTGMPSIVVPPLPGATPPTTCVPYSMRELRVELAHLAHALDEQPRVLVAEDRHRLLAPRAAATAFSPASRSVSAGVMSSPESREDRAALRGVRALEPHHERHRRRRARRAAATTPSAIRSQRTMPPKMLTRIALHVRVAQDQLEGLLDLLLVGAAARVEEVRRARRRTRWIMSSVAIARPAPFTMQPMLPSRPT